MSGCKGEEKVSSGKTAEIAGVTKWEIMETLAFGDIPVQYDVKDLEEYGETRRDSMIVV